MAYGWEYNDDPFEGYDLVVEDGDWDYSWSVTVVLHKDGQYYVASDSGCSCNGPWEDGADIDGPMSFGEALVGLSPHAKEEAILWSPKGLRRTE